MAAFDVFGPERAYLMNANDSNEAGDGSSPNPTAAAPTYAAFSPNQQTASRTRNQKSILIHQKSPLLIATPPEVTRTLAYSHPFILPLDHLAGLLAWRTSDPWESFLLLSSFWFFVLYGDLVLRWAGPIVLITALISALYSRRYSPLSSTMWSDQTKNKQNRKRADSEQRKSLDEILAALQDFAESCDVLIDPFLRLTEYLSTQSTATSATTRPALTTLFVRLLAFTPVWVALTLPPFYIITTKRTILVLGTVAMSWHSRPARITRTILWRSQAIRSTITLITGLSIPKPTSSTVAPPPLPPRAQAAAALKSKSKTKGNNSEVKPRFTFTLFENERRWIGLGWTKSLFAYERQAWTDEWLNEAPSPDQYILPEVDDSSASGLDGVAWRWVPGSEWKVEGASRKQEKSAKRIGGGGGGDDCGWVYYDNKWQDGRKVDGWGRYTRRRKWVRDAELVDVGKANAAELSTESAKDDKAETSSLESATLSAAAKRKSWFGGVKMDGVSTGTSTPKSSQRPAAPLRRHTGPTRSLDSISFTGSTESRRSRESVEEEDVHTPLERIRQQDWDRSLYEGVAEQLS